MSKVGSVSYPLALLAVGFTIASRLLQVVGPLLVDLGAHLVARPQPRPAVPRHAAVQRRVVVTAVRTRPIVRRVRDDALTVSSVGYFYGEVFPLLSCCGARRVNVAAFRIDSLGSR